MATKRSRPVSDTFVPYLQDLSSSEPASFVSLFLNLGGFSPPFCPPSFLTAEAVLVIAFTLPPPPHPPSPIP